MHSNIYTADSIITKEDVAIRAKELGHKTLSSVEHGYFGNIFETYEVAQKHDLNLIFGTEFYFVKDRFEKDNTNSHLLIMARNEEGRKELTAMISESNKTGFYYKPRIDEDLLFKLTPENVVVTTACIASPINKYGDEYAGYFISKCKEYFGKNFYLEVQPHTNIKQIEFNQKLQRASYEYGVELILGIDTHYILPEDSMKRDLFLRGKKINYPEEEGFIIDYPTVQEVVDRFKKQNVLFDREIKQAFDNTLIARDFEPVVLDKEIKMPTIYPELTHDEKSQKLKEVINKAWIEDRKHIDKSKWKDYIEAIKFETDIITETDMEDYFLMNERIIDKAVNEYGGVLTRTGRGCFEETALVHTRDDMKLIKDVKIGDYVINRFGEFDKVVNTWKYDIEEELISIDYLYGQGKKFPINVTKDHKILIMRNGIVDYVRAEDIKLTDFVCLPKMKSNIKKEIHIDLNDYNFYDFKFDDEYIYEEYDRGNSRYNKKIKRNILLDEDFNEFFGLMYGDGNTTSKRGQTNSVELAINTDTSKNTLNRRIVENVAMKLGVEIQETNAKNKNLSVLALKSKVFATFFKENIFSSEINKEKSFNKELFNQSKSNLSALYRGLLNSDGHISKKDSRFSFDNTSTSLINAFKILGIMTGKNPVGIVYREGGTDKRGYNSKRSFKLRGRIGSSKANKKSNTWHEDDNYYYLPVLKKDIVPMKKTSVYDLQVENDPSFLINNMMVHNSAPSFYVNKLLGFTEIDRLEAPIQLYPTRFMSKSRILESRSLPDIDMNTANPEPFIRASRDILGEDNVYWMIAYGTMQDSEAFRNYCRALGLESTNVNTVGKDLESYENDEYWGKIIQESKMFVGVIDSVSPHPCANLLLSSPISEEIGTIKVGDLQVALIDSGSSDSFKYLKNDYLSVTVWSIISDVYKTIGQPIDDVRSLIEKTKDNENVWKLYEQGLVATLNQAGTQSGKPQVMQYAPKDIRELSGWVSAIRPSFSSMKHYFLNRKDFTYDIPEFDRILEASDNFILYQENIMATLVYSGFSEDETYGLLKAIAKKKEGIIEPIHDKFIDGFTRKTGSSENALRVWKIIEDAVSYGFNASHAYSVALDSLYGAYLKANYPLEYYSVVLNIYAKNTSKQSEIISELKHFDIRVKNIKFGKSLNNYTIDENSRAIYKGIGSIKYMNSNVASGLMELSKNKYEKDEFYLLCKDILDTSVADKRQMEILIRLGFFSYFGKPSSLLEIYLCMKGDKKAGFVYLDFANHKATPLKYSSTLVEKNKLKRIDNIKNYEIAVKNNPPTDFSLREMLKYEEENLGYAMTTYPEMNDNVFIVMEVNEKFTPVIKLYKLNDGDTVYYKIKKNKYWENDLPVLKVGDIIKIKEVVEEFGWKLTDEKWTRNENKIDKFINRLSVYNKGGKSKDEQG